MSDVCLCCEHYECGIGDWSCLDCKHRKPDMFKASGKCASCMFDARFHAVCGNCINFDRWQQKTE